MANKNLKSIKFPNLPDTYLIPQGTVTEADLEDFAENGTVANARQLIPSAMETERVPYNFRTSGGSLDIGDREFDKLVGLSLPWNQLAPALNSTNWVSESGVTATYLDGVATISSTVARNGIYFTRNIIANHRYLLTCECKSESGTVVLIGSSSGFYTQVELSGGEGWKCTSTIQWKSADQTSFRLYIFGATTNYNVQAKNFMLVDLTQLFGNTIAEYIYSLETATAGAGVAWFKKFFSKQYYAYNSGEIESVKVSSHDMVGFNQWDEEWVKGYFWKTSNGTISYSSDTTTCIRNKNLIPVLPNTAYHFNKPTVGYLQRLAYFDSDGNFINTLDLSNNNQGGTITTPSNCHYLSFFTEAYGTTYKNDVCINLHWDGARDGEYEPYKKNSYALDPIELRGILKLDSNNEPYADGDTYEADGTVTRKYGIVDLGTLTWSYNSGSLLFYTGINEAVKSANTGLHGVCSKYRCVVGYNPTGGINDTTQDKVFSIGSSYITPGNNLLIRDTAYTDPVAFKTVMSGVYLVYELATPTTESADPFTDPQTVDNWGTEQYVDKAYTDGDRDVEIPVGHETKYPVNLRDKIETAPNAPTSDGDYIVHCESGQLTYIALGSTTTIQNIIARLEALEG